MIAIRFYSQFPDCPEMLSGINPNWPAESRVVQDVSEAQPDETIMSESDYLAHTNNLQPEVRSWLESRQNNV